MSDIERGKRREFQFRLVTLLAGTTLVAVFLSLVQLFGLWLAIFLATYLFAIAAIRTEFGYKQGSVIAAVGTAIVVFPMALLASELLIGVLAVPLGLGLGYVCFLLIHSLALVGTWDIFELNRNGRGLADGDADSEKAE